MLADNVLRLPKDVFFLGHEARGSELFVRQCYVELEGIIFDRVLHGMRRIVVSGTPGTGKSVFALYLLYQLRLQSKTVILQSKENWYRFSDEDGVQRLSPPGEITTTNYLDDEDAWFLCDPKGKESPYQRVCGVTIVTISPNPTRISDFWKELKPIQLFMAMWTLDELKQCRELIYPHVPEDDVEFAHEKVGGVARLAFDKKLLTVHMGSLKQRTKDVRLEDLQMAVDGCNSPSILSTKAVGDKLLSIHPQDGYEVYDIFWASNDARDLAMATLEEKKENMVEAFMLSDKLTGAEAGVIFERLAHKYLEQERDVRRYILGGDDVDTFKLSFDSAEDFEGTRDLIPTTLRKSRYYKPKKKNFEAIDALGECDDVLYIFQMKISGAKFPVPLLANEKLLAKWGKPRIENMSGQIGGYRKCVYVYVVPDVGWKNSENFDEVVKMAKKHNWCDESDECPSARTNEEGNEGVEQDSRDSKAEAMSIDDVWVIEGPCRVKPGIGLAPEQ